MIQNKTVENGSIQFSIQKKIVRNQFKKNIQSEKNPGFNSKKNIQFKIILGQFNSITYSIQNSSGPIQFNEISNLSLEFQEVLHDEYITSHTLDLCHCQQKGPYYRDRVPKVTFFGVLGPIWASIYISGSLFSVFWLHLREECQFSLHVYNNELS